MTHLETACESLPPPHVLTRPVSDEPLPKTAQSLADELLSKQPRLGDRTFLVSFLAPPLRVPELFEDEEEEAEKNGV